MALESLMATDPTTQIATPLLQVPSTTIFLSDPHPPTITSIFRPPPLYRHQKGRGSGIVSVSELAVAQQLVQLRREDDDPSSATSTSSSTVAPEGGTMLTEGYESSHPAGRAPSQEASVRNDRVHLRSEQTLEVEDRVATDD